MGIKNLNSLIETYSPSGIQLCSLTAFRGKKVAVDANVYLYKYMYGKATPIDGIFFMVNKFKKFHMTPIFVFDGKPPCEKEMTLQYRKQIKNRLETRIQEINHSMEQLAISGTGNDPDTTMVEDELRQQLQHNERRLIYISDEIIHLVKRLFDMMGVSYIDSPMEAEHLCAKLCRAGYVDAVVSEDMDAIACGSPVVLRDFSNRRDDIRVYTMQRILDDMGITYSMFVDMCILLGNDYMPRARGYTPDMIYSDICQHETIEQIKQMRTFRLPDEYQCRRLRALLNLDEISISDEEWTRQLRKHQDLNKLKEFMCCHSTIDMDTISNRVEKMFSSEDRRPSVMDIRQKVETQVESRLPWFSITPRIHSEYRTIRGMTGLATAPSPDTTSSFVH